MTARREFCETMGEDHMRNLTHSPLLVVCVNAIPTILDRPLDPKENTFESRILVQGMYDSLRTVPIAGRDLANTEE